MPLYEFRCEDCSNVLERLCRMGENGRRLTCPTCGKRGLRRLMSVCATRVAGRSASPAGAGAACSGCTSGNCASCH